MTNIEQTHAPSPLVSVVMPNRNHGEYLRTCIPRFLTQTFSDFEIIVVDDQSSDSSCAIVEEFAKADGRVRLIRLEHHAGVAGAFTNGAKEARGTFIYGAAADDFVAPSFLERSVRLLEQSPKAAFCFSDPTERFTDGSKRTFPLYLSETERAFSSEEIVELLRCTYFHFSSNTIVFRRALFMQAGGFDKDLHWFCDWFVTTVLVLRYGACYVPDSLTEFQISPASYSAVSLRKSKQQRELFVKILSRLETPEYADILPAFKRAGLLPEYRYRNILWLRDPRLGTNYFSRRLIFRILARGSMYHFRRFVPVSFRKVGRKVTSLLAR